MKHPRVNFERRLNDIDVICMATIEILLNINKWQRGELTKRSNKCNALLPLQSL